MWWCPSAGCVVCHQQWRDTASDQPSVYAAGPPTAQCHQHPAQRQAHTAATISRPYTRIILYYIAVKQVGKSVVYPFLLLIIISSTQQRYFHRPNNRFCLDYLLILLKETATTEYHFFICSFGTVEVVIFVSMNKDHMKYVLKICIFKNNF